MRTARWMPVAVLVGIIQASAPSRLTASMPTAAPTGPLVSWPAWVLRPSASDVVVAARLRPALVGQRDGVRQRRVGQRVRRGVRHRAGHVRHAVERRVVHLVRRVRVRGRVGVLEAAALVDRDVDEHRARLHLRDQLVGDQLRRRRARDQHGADDHVGLASPAARSRAWRTPGRAPGCCSARTTSAACPGRCRAASRRRPCPSAMLAAFWPDTPAPMMTTFAFATPPTPPISTPRPPWALSSE